MKKTLVIFSITFISLLSFATSTFAHVVVKPAEVGIGSFQTFSIGVPNEKDNPTVAVRLSIPAGIEHVTPNVKPGWNIEVKKNGDGEDAKVTEIIWTDGTIPVEQRDEFSFSAKVPTKETTIQWKAYQTYENGDVISWDQKPAQEEKDDDKSMTGPYSQTNIINDLTKSKIEKPVSQNNLAIQLSIIAFVLAIASFSMQLRKK